ncbi:winged helix-turn-helix domain-containing protein [Streptomyces iakyrus]|uniref:ArsR/SmtB family transcription factor n=1 Tax=Streptomyces iakyrus TaxID=68219 RepID=UPI000A76D94F|nr:winged helix-turn-helix domain-containing protein [Streptomyces iakyrus]
MEEGTAQRQKLHQRVDELTRRINCLEQHRIVPTGPARLDDTELDALREEVVALLAEIEGSGATTRLRALGHPVRLRILAALLDRPHSARELLQLCGATATSGLLYHHLQLLISAGWVARSSRGHHAVADTERTVAALAAVHACR